MKKVLVTGAAGLIGSAFWKSQQCRFQFLLCDVRPVDIDGSTAQFRHLDVTRLDDCIEACAGIDTVVHLAANASPDADFMASLLPLNIVGTFNMLEAAKRCGCTRFVYASSAQAVEGYPLDVQVDEAMAPRPKNFYGASKAFGEAALSLFARDTGTVGIAVRIANVAEFHPGELHSPRDMAAFISVRDLVELISRCIDADISGFHVVNGVSDNRYKRLAIDQTRRLLQYAPQDDSFEIVEGQLGRGEHQ